MPNLLYSELPPLPDAVGFITRTHAEPGRLVADGGRIISVPVLINDNELPGNLFTEVQMREYAQKAISQSRA